MKKVIQTLIILLVQSIAINAQDIPIPQNYSIVQKVSGDLDKDSVKELVVIYNTQLEDENSMKSIPRELIIYKQEGGKWVSWKNSVQALYGSRDGGMMGDPFEKMEINKGILSISQNGGSSWKWGFTDKYRFQDGEFYLIGYSSQGGKDCETWMVVDFNLSTGKMIVKKDYMDCKSPETKIAKREHETLYEKDIKVTLQKRNDMEIRIVTPKYGHEIYLSVKG